MKKLLRETYGVGILIFYFLKWPYVLGFPYIYFVKGLQNNWFLNFLWFYCFALIIKDLYIAAGGVAEIPKDLNDLSRKMINKKSGILLLIILGFAGLTLAQTPLKEADAIIGTWLMPDDEGIIEIFKENGYYNGKIIWMKEKEEDGSPLKDKENPDEKLRDRPVEGLEVMKGFKYEGENTWSGGSFYAAKKGKEVEPEFVLEDENHLNIEISIFIFSLTVELTRVDTAEYFHTLNSVNKN